MLIYLLEIEGVIDKAKFSEIYIRYRKLMFYAAKRITKNDEDAEDAVHEACIHLCHLMDKIDEPVSDKTKVFILTITERRASEICRKRLRRTEISFDEAWIEPENDRSEEIVQKDSLYRALEGLAEEGRQALLLKYDHGLSVEEIAEVFGKSRKAVYKMLERGKAQLAENLKEEGVEIEW